MAIKSKTETMPQEPRETVSPAPTPRTGPGPSEAPQQPAAGKRRGLRLRSGVFTSGLWQWHALDLQIGFRYRQPKDERDCFEVWAFPAVQEIPGGPHDDETGGTGFDFEVLHVLQEFVAEQVGVSTVRSPDHPELILKGKFRGQAVLLHVSLEPPKDVAAADACRTLAPTVSQAPTHRTSPGQPEAPQQQAGEKRGGLSVKSDVITGGCWQWHALDLQFGFRYRQPEDERDCWEVWAFPAVPAILGGTHEGETVNFDSEFLAEFEAEHMGVRTAISADPPELILKGKLWGKAVLLHVSLEPPEDLGATEVIDLTAPGGAGGGEKD
jgi:hypothetical protein